MDDRSNLASLLSDPDLVHYFYLDLEARAVLERLEKLTLTLTPKSDDAPFNALVKGYSAAVDQEGHAWIVKAVNSAEEALYHRICTLVFLLDHHSGTLAAPLTLTKINGLPYRATKVVRHGVQISSYNYLDRPFIDYLRQDLVNRWIYFDEDRNPNNYLVIQNSKKVDFLVAIDFDKSDLVSPKMKITGDPDKFGWFRTEKTRFLTLLRPEHFQDQPIELFDARLKAFTSLTRDLVLDLALPLCRGWAPDAEGQASSVAENILERSRYVDHYFRRWFQPESEIKSHGNDDDYSAFGKSFLQMYSNKK